MEIRGKSVEAVLRCSNRRRTPLPHLVGLHLDLFGEGFKLRALSPTLWARKRTRAAYSRRSCAVFLPHAPKPKRPTRCSRRPLFYLEGRSPLPPLRRRDCIVGLRKRLQPRCHAGWDVGVSSRPSPDKAIITLKYSGETPLRPSQRGQAFAEAFRRHRLTSSQVGFTR